MLKKQNEENKSEKMSECGLQTLRLSKKDQSDAKAIQSDLWYVYHWRKQESDKFKVRKSRDPTASC